MKKFILISLLLMFLNAPAFADNCYTGVCPDVPKVNGSISSALSSVTGVNWMLTSVLEGQIERELNKELNANFKVDITPFGGKSLIEGKFKKFTAHSDYARLSNIYTSNIDLESLCGYNHFIYKNGKVYTNENFVMGYSAQVTSSDLQKIIASPEYQQKINSIRVRAGKLSLFQLSDAKAKIVNDRIVVSVLVTSPFSLGEPLRVVSSMDVEVNNGKLVVTDIKTTPNLASMNLGFLLPVINKLNPFEYSASMFTKEDSTIKVNDFKIENNTINIKGVVIVAKNYYNN